ncbi:MAG: PaaI family thioesterase, partial [Trebonia sp.]
QAPPVPPGETAAPAGAPADLTELLGARIQVADGGASVDFPVTGDLANPLGNAHGGVIFAAADLAAQAALMSVGGPLRTASVRVSYTRPVPGGVTARLEAQVVHRGRSLGVVQVTARGEKGKPAVIATVTTARE